MSTKKLSFIADMNEKKFKAPKKPKEGSPSEEMGESNAEAMSEGDYQGVGQGAKKQKPAPQNQVTNTKASLAKETAEKQARKNTDTKTRYSHKG